jgi:hypothetical protein
VRQVLRRNRGPLDLRQRHQRRAATCRRCHQRRRRPNPRSGHPSISARSTSKSVKIAAGRRRAYTLRVGPRTTGVRGRRALTLTEYVGRSRAFVAHQTLSIAIRVHTCAHVRRHRRTLGSRSSSADGSPVMHVRLEVSALLARAIRAPARPCLAAFGSLMHARFARIRH